MREKKINNIQGWFYKNYVILTHIEKKIYIVTDFIIIKTLFNVHRICHLCTLST